VKLESKAAIYLKKHLIKNWFPLLSKNFEPIADIVGIAAVMGTSPRRDGAPAKTKRNHIV
jgi:hypothetical protein